MQLKSIISSLTLVLFATGMMFAQGDSKNPVVLLETNKGNIKIELYTDKAPETVKNFLNYVEKKHYDGTIFHRVIAKFMIQGGGMNPGMSEKKTDAPIKNEAKNGLSNTRGTIAMARTGNPHSATAQFFINIVDNRFLDQPNARDGWGYCVFGKVIEGMDTVDRIKAISTTSVGGHQDVPTEDIIIKSAKKVQ
ncbi:MAG: peptidyl-prolyl cis-trans isomerase [Planctomycetia bacterium]|nr:peptidyl-prolyl cis-trans isomerase [Planctomycetia bacterium]